MNHPWLARDSLALPRPIHYLHKNPKCLLSKFFPDTFGPLEVHIMKSIQAIRLINVQHEYIVYLNFPYIF